MRLEFLVSMLAMHKPMLDKREDLSVYRKQEAFAMLIASSKNPFKR